MRFLVTTAAALIVLASPASADEPVVPPSASCPGLPDYPSSERASGVSGKVTLKVLIDPTGAVTELSVSAGLGKAFDESALEAARRCTFTAATLGGKAVPAAIELSVDFTAPPAPARLEGQVVGELGEPLAGAAVTAGASSCLTNAEGRFALDFDPPPDGELWVVVAKPDYADAALPERLKPGETRHVRFALVKKRVLETRVVGNRMLPPPPKVDRTPQVSRFQITRADIDRTPGALEDITRVVQDLPGVVADPDLMATFFVRGGGPEEVGYYLDGVPLANPFHLGGFASIYNPMLIDSADFFAGGIPAGYEPALSGVLEIRYVTGETTRPKVQADVSMHTAKLRVDTPTGIDGLSVMLSARRSYFELYFAGLRAFHIVGQSYVAPDITEYTARAHYRRGRHQLTATFLHASDGLSFLVKPGEQVLVNFAGNLSLSNVMQLGILQEKIDLGGGNQLSLTGAFTREDNDTRVTTETVFARDTSRKEGFGRADLMLAFSEKNRMQLGLQFARRIFEFNGQVQDSRGIAPWIARPFVTTNEANLDIHPSGLRNVLAAYVEHTYRPLPPIAVEAGMRVQADLASAQSTYALRAAASYELPTATVLKVSSGLATQFQANPLLLDATYGNPRLEPERAAQLVVGLEQPLPIEALVRIEGFAKWLDYLTVSADTPAAAAALQAAGQPAFQSVGRGFARGVDALILGRARHFSYGLSCGLVWSDRENPLATTVSRYPSPWDQRFTTAAHVSYTPNQDWLFSARGSFHTGRPVTPVLDFVRDDAQQRYLPVFGDTNSARYPNYYELSLRGERRFLWGPLSMAWYAEVLNVTNAQNLFATLYDEGDFQAGTPPQSGAFNHLPIRPFLGIRGDY